jgi:hypothetical protein
VVAAVATPSPKKTNPNPPKKKKNALRSIFHIKKNLAAVTARFFLMF